MHPYLSSALQAFQPKQRRKCPLFCRRHAVFWTHLYILHTQTYVELIHKEKMIWFKMSEDFPLHLLFSFFFLQQINSSGLFPPLIEPYKTEMRRNQSNWSFYITSATIYNTTMTKSKSIFIIRKDMYLALEQHHIYTETRRRQHHALWLDREKWQYLAQNISISSLRNKDEEKMSLHKHTLPKMIGSVYTKKAECKMEKVI